MMARRFLDWVLDHSLLPLAQYLASRVVFQVRDTEKSPLPAVLDVKLAEPPTVTVKNLAPEYQGHGAWRYPRLIMRVTQEELQKSVELIQAHLDHVYLAPTDREIRRYALRETPGTGMVLEFGVFDAASTNDIAGEMQRRGDPRMLHAFDSFEGLPEDGAGWVWQKGRFSRGGVLPEVLPNVKLHRGWIEETLPGFLDEHPDESIAFIHVDVDIYSPTKTILSVCKSRLRRGSIIVFDELIGYAGWRFHEYRALTEVFSAQEYEYIAFSDFGQAAIRIR